MTGKLSRIDQMKINRKRKQMRKGDAQRERFMADTQYSTLLDYVKWVGDFGFDVLPFREADAMILCLASYFEILPLFAEGRQSAEFSECAELVDTGRAKLMITGTDMGNTDIFRAAAASKRFGELVITDYIDKLTADPPLQFATMTFRYRDEFAFIAFRGTDSSLAGWRENFMISFTRTTAQSMAAEHVSRLIEPGPDWYIGGHSKGGNLALISACVLDEEQLDLVKRVYVLDGPGLCPEVFDEQLIHKIDPIATRIVPEFDVVGKLFEPRITDTRIVKSYRKGIEQHSLASWLVDHGDLSSAPSNSSGSRWIGDLTKEWIAGVPLEERAVFVGELFDSMEEEGINDLQEVSPEYFGNLIIRLSGKSDTTKKVMGSIPRKLLLDEPPKKALKNRAKEFFKNSVLIGALLLIAAGVLSVILREKVVNNVAIVVVAIIAAIELFVIVRRLIRTKGNLLGLRERLIITGGLLAFIPVVIIKENARFVLGSLILGVLMLSLAPIIGERAVREKRLFMRIVNITECVVSVGIGVAFLLIPEASVRVFTLVMGIVMLVFAAVRIGFLIWYRVKHGNDVTSQSETVTSLTTTDEN